MYYLADFAMDEQQAPPMWTLATGSTVPGVLARGAIAGGVYGTGKYFLNEPKRQQKNAYNIVTGGNKLKRLKKMVKPIVKGAVKGAGLTALGVGATLGAKGLYDQYRERTKKWWEL